MGLSRASIVLSGRDVTLLSITIIVLVVWINQTDLMMTLPDGSMLVTGVDVDEKEME